MYEILKDAYSFDERCAICWDENWKQSDVFFFDNPDIADKYGFVTCCKAEPIGFICWDPRNRPEYVEIGHNGIRTKYRGKGFGKAQLRESLSEEWILDHVQIERVEIWKTDNRPKYWTAIYFSSEEDFPELLAKVLISDSERGGTWYVDLKRDGVKYIILKDHVLTYRIGDEAGKRAVCERCRELGIVEKQLDWAE